jgi:uncharacterized protein YgiM (DUF1202 family)
VVLVSALNLRASPSSAGSIRAILNEGTHLTLVAYHGQWVRVTTDDGKSGWVLARFIGPAPLGRFAVVLVPALNLRARPSFTGAVRDVLPQGTRLTVLASHGQWARVRTDGARGWVLACFLGSATGTT